MSWLITNTFSAFLLPPLNLLLLLMLGIMLLNTRPQLARGLLCFGVAALWLLSTPVVSCALLQSLEQDTVLQSTDAQAIVLLGAGRYFNAPEYGGDTIGGYALERTRYAAHLARQTGLPILSSGGTPDGDGPAEGLIMKQVLEHEFHVPVRWVEDQSNNTADEARECWELLAPQGITKIALVTHAWHMRRAKQVFVAAGFEVTPAPMGFATSAPFNILHLLPNAEALRHSKRAMHEWIGLAWYGLRH
ncbi:MAG: YdcF family protein [Methylophilaceae bacterium]